MKHPYLPIALAWLNGEIERGPVRQRPCARQIREAILTFDDDYVTERAWQWLNDMAAECSKWRQQANWCLDILEPVVKGPPTIVCPMKFDDGEAA